MKLLKIFAFIMVLSVPAFSDGPKRNFQGQAALNDEFENAYHDIKYPKIVSGTAQSLTVKNLTLGGILATNSCGYVFGTVVQSSVGFNNSNVTNSGTTSATKLYASIMPKCATDKIMVTATGQIKSPIGQTTFATIKRAGSDLDPFSSLGFCASGDGTLAEYTYCSMIWLDSPATTSQTLYQVYLGGNGANSWNPSTMAAVIKLDEIAY